MLSLNKRSLNRLLSVLFRQMSVTTSTADNAAMIQEVEQNFENVSNQIDSVSRNLKLNIKVRYERHDKWECVVTFLFLSPLWLL